MNYSVIILAAGSGKRTGLNYNKMFYKIGLKTIYETTLSIFNDDSRCTQIIVVAKENEIRAFKELTYSNKVIFVEGGKERQDSVYNGIQKVVNDYVLIHDGARPYLKIEELDNLLDCLKQHNACLLMVPCKDTVKEVFEHKVVKTLNRKKLMNAQTPQAFKTSLIKECLQKAHEDNFLATDDTSLIEEYAPEDIYVVEGDYSNIKVTTKEDL
ncbi:MAG: 2-C-methyl-D-erythritol 4-phosphate cytidylyltransferase [Thomasclavelia sp.]|jgi:2-C-methyl-D-erythritol 4-phosphate cytidylyltransferase|nr:2-C-methyl-D-erythritol 4-phosphate cytidylyltransferase [Thomasclavelia sp.]